MTYEQLRYAKAAVMHACSGVTCKDAPDGRALMVRHDARLGKGYQQVNSLEELYTLLPETAGYPGAPEQS
jgi:hypothetical protein